MCENGDAFCPEKRATHCELILCMGDEHAGPEMFSGFPRIAVQVPLRVLDIITAIAAELLRVFWKQPVLVKKLCSAGHARQHKSNGCLATHVQADMQANMQAGVQANMQTNMQADNGKHKRTHTHARTQTSQTVY